MRRSPTSVTTACGGLPQVEKLFKDLTGGAEILPEVRQMLAGSGLGA